MSLFLLDLDEAVQVAHVHDIGLAGEIHVEDFATLHLELLASENRLVGLLDDIHVVAVRAESSVKEDGSVHLFLARALLLLVPEVGGWAVILSSTNCTFRFDPNVFASW